MPPANNHKDRRKSALEIIEKVIAIVPGIGTLAVAVSLWTNHALILFYDYPYQVIFTLWVLSMIGVVRWGWRARDHERRPPLRRGRKGLMAYVAPTMVGLLATAATGYSWWFVQRLITTPTPYVSPSAWAPSFGIPAAQADTPSPPARASIDVIDGASSLTRRPGRLFVVEPNQEIVETLVFQRGREDHDPTYYPRIREWLKDRAVQVGKPQDRFFLGDGVNLVKLTYEHSNVVNDLRPTQAEFDKLSQDQKETVGRWLTRYVGQWEAALRISVDNTQGKRKFLAQTLTIHVTAIKERKGVIPNLLAYQEVHATLPYQKGDTDLRFLQTGAALEVPAGGSATFNVLLSAPPNAPILPQWDGEMSLKTSIGTIPLGKFVLATYNTRWQAGPAQRAP